MVEAPSLKIRKVAIRLNEKEVAKGDEQPSFSDDRRYRQTRVILIADDDQLTREMIKIALEPMGRILEAKDGMQAVALYESEKPDIVFLDIHMPGQKGLDALRQIFSLDRDAYVVMQSADSSPENVYEVLASGAKGFVTKPFTPEKLIAVLKACPAFA